MTDFEFKVQNDFEKRSTEAGRIRKKYPNRVPVICEKASRTDIQKIDKTKYLVPADLTVGQFVYVIRKRLDLKPETAIYILVNNTYPKTSELMSTIYDNHKSDDGFLYLKYRGDDSFGFEA